jgi:hypothetical protein
LKYIHDLPFHGFYREKIQMLNPLLKSVDQLRLGKSLYASGFILSDSAINISLFADLLEKEPENLEKYLGTIRIMSERITHISRDLIALSELAFVIQEHKPSLSNETLPSLLEMSIDRLKEHITSYQLEFVKEIDPDLRELIPTSFPSLRLFFDALTRAAVMITPEGSSVEISIRKVSELDQGNIQINVDLLKEEIEQHLKEDPFEGYTLFGRRGKYQPVSGIELLIASLYTIILGGESKFDLTDEKIRFKFCFPYESLFGNSSA